MKYTAFWLTLAACCAFSAGTAFAQGAGQGQHEVGSGVGNPSEPAGGGGGIGGNNTSGQGHYGPNGSGGANEPSNIHNGSPGQGHFEAGGSGGGYNAAPNAVYPAPQPQIVGPNNARQGQMGRMNAGPNDWRFVYSDGIWWYYQPDNSWTYYTNGSWQNFNEPRTARVEREHRTMQENATVNPNVRQPGNVNNPNVREPGNVNNAPKVENKTPNKSEARPETRLETKPGNNNQKAPTNNNVQKH